MTAKVPTCSTCGGPAVPGGEATPERGVWVVYQHDHGPQVESVHATELEALREINDAAGKRATFVPFGSEIREALR